MDQAVLAELTAFFEKIRQGDFSHDLPMPQEQSQLSSVVFGLNQLLATIREQEKQIAREVAARIQMQDVSYRQQQDFKALTEDSPDIIARFDRECRYVYVNPTIEKVSGIPVSSFIGKTQKELSIPADQEVYWRTHIEAVFQTGMEKIIEFSFQTPTQGIRYFQARLVPEKAQNGAIQYVLAVAHDVTELKTHAEEVNHAKDQFISLVSHELRTPLTAIKGLISMMLHGDYGEISDRMRLPLTNVYTAALRQIHLINDLLSLSRLQTGRIHYTFSTFLPQTIVAQVISSYEPQAKVKRVELISDPGEQIMVQADDLWVKEVIDNLVANSLKFTETGSIHISYRYEADQVSIIVTDTGTGITPEQQQKLFGKFEQLITPEKGKAVGTGLGLYISRAVARQMGGDVFLEKSTQGQGSTFVFVLPKAGGQRAQLAKQELEKTQKLALNKSGV